MRPGAFLTNGRWDRPVCCNQLWHGRGRWDRFSSVSKGTAAGTGHNVTNCGRDGIYKTFIVFRWCPRTGAGTSWYDVTNYGRDGRHQSPCWQVRYNQLWQTRETSESVLASTMYPTVADTGDIRVRTDKIRCNQLWQRRETSEAVLATEYDVADYTARKG